MRITIDIPDCPPVRSASKSYLAEYIRRRLSEFLAIAAASIEVEVE